MSTTRTVKRIWYQYREIAAKNNGVGDVGNKRKHNCGRKRKATVLDSLEEKKKLPKKDKKSQRRLSIATGVSQSTISLEGSAQRGSKEVQGAHASSSDKQTENQ